MKKLCTVSFLLLVVARIYGQAPQLINYQAVARAATGNVLPNQFISIEINIRDGSPMATVVYQEIDTASTNQFGLFSIAIGAGQVQVGANLAAVNWATGNKYLEVGFDPAGGGNFTNMGISQLLSVPYALFAGNGGVGMGYTHNIGDLFGGGIIVDVWDSAGVQHGLIASLTDLSDSAEWSNITGAQIGPAAESYSNGKTNTLAILSQSGATSGAAFFCVNYNGGGYTDWYLPAIWELEQCYKSAAIVNHNLGDINGFQGGYYWSSSEGNNVNAYSWLFNYGDTNYIAKYGAFSVRAVRRY